MLGNWVETHPGWDDRSANIFVVAIITIVAPLVVRCAPSVQRENEPLFHSICDSIINLAKCAMQSDVTLGNLVFEKHLRRNSGNFSGGESPEEIS